MYNPFCSDKEAKWNYDYLYYVYILLRLHAGGALSARIVPTGRAKPPQLLTLCVVVGIYIV